MQDRQHGQRHDEDDALRRAVDALRELIVLVVTVDAPADVLAMAGRHVAAAAALLAPFRRAADQPRPHGAMTDAATLMPFDPIIGPLSPLAPPLRMSWEPPTAVGTVTFTAPYEGPPRCVHGGIIAAAFDQVFNVANLMLGNPGPTASLRLSYRHPTPLGLPLRFEGWQESVQGRRVHTRGRLLVGDRVTVEAEGVFAIVPIERILQMLAADDRGERDD